MLRPASILDRGARPRRNLVVNPSFEVSTATGWSTNGATVTRSTNWANRGTASMRATGTPATTAGDARLLGGSPTTFPPGLTPGGTFRMSCWYYTPVALTTFDTSDTSRQHRILLIYSTNGTSYDVFAFGPQFPNIVGVQRVWYTFTLPLNATGGILAIGVAGSPADPSYVTYLDAVMLEAAPGPGAPPDAFDGTARNARWEGTAHSAPSVGFGYPGRP